MTQIRSSSLRRLVVPLGLSVAFHACFVLLAWLAPSTPPTPTTPAPTPLSIRVSFDQDRRDARVEQPIARPGLPDEAEPTLLPPDKGQDVSVSTPPAPANVGGGHSATGNGTSPSGVGSRPPLLAAPANAHRVTYVIDRSMSMGATDALARAKRELVASLRALPPTCRFQVILYNRGTQPLLPGDWHCPDADTIATVEASLRDVSATGGTDHVGALRSGVMTRAEALFWVTDADELTAAGVSEVTRLNAARTRIHVVELARGRPETDSLLKTLAEKTNGDYRRVAP